MTAINDVFLGAVEDSQRHLENRLNSLDPAEVSHMPQSELDKLFRLDYTAHVLHDTRLALLGIDYDPYDSYAIIDGAAYYDWYKDNINGGFFAPKRLFVARIGSSKDAELSEYFGQPFKMFYYPGTGGGLPSRFIVGPYIY